MTPGDLALATFPFSAHASAPWKRRPVLILSNVGVAPDQAIFVAMVTGNSGRVLQPQPGDLQVKEWQAAGLVKPSVIRTRRLWTAEDRDLVRVLGQVPPELLEQARQAVRDMLA